jgi:hypothetical protein
VYSSVGLLPKRNNLSLHPEIGNLDLPRSQYNEAYPIRSSPMGLIHCNEHHICWNHGSSA